MNLLSSATAVAFLYTNDRARALAYYCETLGFTHSSSDDFGDFVDLGGALMRLTVLPGHQPTAHPVLGWNVEDIGASVTALRDRGVAFIIFPGMGQDEHGIWTSPDGRAKVAFFADADGNVLSLAQV